MAKQKVRLGELLLSKKIITEDELKKALDYVQKNRVRLGDALVRLNIISEDKLLAALRYHFGITAVDLKNVLISGNIIKLVPKDLAKKHMAIPYKIEGAAAKKTLMVVMSNPTDLNAITELEFITGYSIQPVLSKDSEIIAALKQYYDVVIDRVVPRAKTEKAESESEGMTIIRGGEEVKIVSEEEAPKTPPKEAPKTAPKEAPKEVLEEAEVIESVFELPYEAFIEEKKLFGELESELAEDFGVPFEIIIKNRKVLKTLIMLLIEKGIITASEIADKFRKED
jgi:hypothetical protein